jgi:hypothetical protein
VVLCKFRQLQLSFRSKKLRVFPDAGSEKSCLSGKNQKLKFFDFYPESTGAIKSVRTRKIED